MYYMVIMISVVIIIHNPYINRSFRHQSCIRVLRIVEIVYSSRFVRVILAQGHANLLRIAPILTDDPWGESNSSIYQKKPRDKKARARPS